MSASGSRPNPAPRRPTGTPINPTPLRRGVGPTDTPLPPPEDEGEDEAGLETENSDGENTDTQDSDTQHADAEPAEPEQRLPPWFPLFNPRLRRGLALALAALIVMLSVIPNPPIPTGAADTIGLGAHADKIAHFLAYLALAFASCYALYDPRTPAHRTVLIAVLSASLLGLLVEIVQGLLPYRHLNPGDMLANTLGAALAGALWILLAHRRKASPQHKDPDAP